MAGYIRDSAMDSDDKASYYPARNEDEKAIVSIVYVRVDNNASISFNIIDPKEKDITIYSDLEKDASDDQTIYTDVIFKNE